MASIRDCLAAARQLDASPSPRLDVEVLLAFVLERDRTYLYTWPERSLSDEQQLRFDELLQRRRAGEPVAHLLGRREFWNLELAVDASTLIPRPDTELLVELALGLNLPTEVRALDLGTGTGAIALALASERPAWQVLAVDRSARATRLAERNRQHLALGQVEIRQSDWFGSVDGQFHLVVSNPPYIDPADPHLQQGDLRFEPHSALVAGEQGLADLRHIVVQAHNYLRAGGWLLLEHGYHQGAAVRELLRAAGYEAVSSERDLAGHERVSLGCWQPGRQSAAKPA